MTVARPQLKAVSVSTETTEPSAVTETILILTDRRAQVVARLSELEKEQQVLTHELALLDAMLRPVRAQGHSTLGKED